MSDLRNVHFGTFLRREWSFWMDPGQLFVQIMESGSLCARTFMHFSNRSSHEQFLKLDGMQLDAGGRTPWGGVLRLLSANSSTTALYQHIGFDRNVQKSTDAQAQRTRF